MGLSPLAYKSFGSVRRVSWPSCTEVKLQGLHHGCISLRHGNLWNQTEAKTVTGLPLCLVSPNKYIISPCPRYVNATKTVGLRSVVFFILVLKLSFATSSEENANVRPPTPPSQEMLFQGWLLNRSSTPKLVSFKRDLDLLACPGWPIVNGSGEALYPVVHGGGVFTLKMSK